MKRLPEDIEWTRRNRKKPFSREEKAQNVQKLCSGEAIGLDKKTSSARRAAKEIAVVYAEKHAQYHNRRSVNWRSRFTKNKGVQGCCSRAIVQADLLCVSPEEYIEAQFWFFDKAFGRAPKYPEIAAAGAIVRVRDWQTSRRSGEAPKRIISAVTRGRLDPQDTLPKVVEEYETMVLERMIKQWGSEQIVWELFGEPKNEEVFSLAFKQTREAWQHMYQLPKKRDRPPWTGK